MEMSLDDIREFESEFSQGKLRGRVIDLENGLLLLLSDSERFRISLSAVAIPPAHGRKEPVSTGFLSTGLHATLVRTIAERVAAWTNQTCMLVIAVNGLNRELMMEIIAILKNYLVT